MDLFDAINTRRSIKTYDPAHEISDDVLTELFTQVQRAPSSFNLQHTRFVVVRDPQKRAELMAAAWGQPHVGAAPVDIIVCAKLSAHTDADRANAHAPPEVREKLVPLIEGIYQDNPQLMRDEAVRSGSLGSMTLMLVARSMGLDTCPMIGFDPRKVAEIVGLDDDHIPVMLITLGKRGDGDVFPTSRFDLSETVKLETLDGPGI